MKIRTTLHALMTVGLILALSTTAWSGPVTLVGTGNGALQANGTTKIDIIDPDNDNVVDTTEWGPGPTGGFDTNGVGLYNANNSTEQWSKVFDNSNTSGASNWGGSKTKVCCNFGNPSGVRVDSSTSLYEITGYTISTGNDSTGRRPNAWKLEGSNNDGATWTLIDDVVASEINGGAGWTAHNQVGEVASLDVTGNAYSSFRFLFTSVVSGGFQINEIELFGVEGSLYDTTLTSVADSDWHQTGTWTGGPPNVPTADTLAQVHNGHTVTVSAGNPGLAKDVDIDATSILQISDTLTVGGAVVVGGTTNIAGTLNAASVDVAAGATLAAPGTLNADEVNTAGTTSLTGGGTIGTVNVTGGTTALSTPDIDTLNVTGGEVTTTGLTVTEMNISAGGTVTATGDLQAGTEDLGGTINITDANIAATGGGTVKLNGTTLNSAGAVNVTGDVKISANPDLNVTSGHLTIDVPAGGALPSGVQLWLDADTLGLGNGAVVSNWTDISGLGRDADYMRGDPNYITGALNGKAVVDFDGNDYLSTSFDFDSVLANHTILTVSRYTGGDSQRVISSRNHNWLFGYHGNRDERWHAEGWIHDTGDGNTDWHLHAGTMQAASDPLATFWKDGVLKTSNDTGSNNSNYKPGMLSLGAWRNENDESSKAQVAEVLIFDRVLTADELNDVGGYLNNKYNLGIAGYTGGLGSPQFGNLTMAPESELTLGGAGEASFAGIAAGDNAEIHGNVTAKGSVQVGNSVGTLKIDGNYTQGAGSTYKWEADTGGADVVAVNNGDLDTSADWNLEIAPLHHSVDLLSPTALMTRTGTGTTAAPGTVSVTLADNVYADLYDTTGATVTKSGEDIVLSGVTQKAKTVSNGGDWDTGVWSSGVPNNLKAAVVAGGTVASTGGAAMDLVVAGGDLDVTAGTLAVGNNVRIGTGSQLTVDGAGTLVSVGNEAKVYAGGTLHLKDGGALGSAVKILDGGTLKTTGNQTLPGNVEFDPNGTLRVAGGILTVPSGGGMPTGNVLWLDASDIQGNGTATVGGVPVTVWTDKSGASHNGTNGGDPATFVTGGGIPTVRLDGNDWIRTALNIDASVRPNVTIFAVYDYRQADGDDSLWGQEDGGWDRFTLLNHGVGAGVTNGDGMFNVVEMGQAGIGFVINEIQMVEGVGNGSHVLINGNAPSGGGIFTMNNSAGGPANQFAIGSQRANNATWTTMMDVAEFLVFDRVLTAEEQNDVGGYLAAKYGLTSGYTGGFGVKLGNLLVDAGATLDAGGGAISVNDLGGAGTVNADVTVNGQVSPGDSPGTLTVTGEMTMAEGTSYLWQLGPGGYDSIFGLNGDLMLPDDWTLVLQDLGGSAAPGDVFRLFGDFTGYSGNLVPFVDASMVPHWDVSGLTFSSDVDGIYMSGLIATPSVGVIPEPITMIALGMGIAGLGGYIRKRRRA